MKNHILEEDLMESCYVEVLKTAFVGFAISIFFKHLYMLKIYNTLPNIIAKMGIIWYKSKHIQRKYDRYS